MGWMDGVLNMEVVMLIVRIDCDDGCDGEVSLRLLSACRRDRKGIAN